MRIQYNDYSCGPIALYNAYFHKYGKYPNISLRTICKKCLTNDEWGTMRWNLIENDVIKLDKPIYNINKIMNIDTFILLYSFGEKYAHYVFVVKELVEGQVKYHIYNYCDDFTDNYINITKDSESFRNLLQCNPRVGELDFPLAWKC